MERRSFRHLTFKQRIQIEAFLKAKWTAKRIATELGVHISTIYREMKRGEYYKRRGYDWKDIRSYSSDRAEAIYRKHLAEKGKGLKIERDRKLILYLEKAILKDKMSPEAALGSIKNSGLKFRVNICTTSLYKYIAQGIFANIRNIDLPLSGNRRTRERTGCRQRKRQFGKNIEERNDIVLTREEFGHWEMDTVKSNRRSSKCLLVLTERKTRYELLYLMDSGRANEVIRGLAEIRSRFNANWEGMFKSITMDNGVEFSNYNGMRAITGHTTQFYYCHPYSSWERGSNENQNKLIRRWWPKKSSFQDKTETDVKRLENWINHYPRKLFGYRTAEDMYKAELAVLHLDDP